MIAEALRSAVRGRVLGEDSDIQILTGGLRTAAGESVSPETALKVASVYGAVSIISAGIRAMPLRILRDAADGVLPEARESRLWGLLHDQANPEMHASALWEYFTLCLLLRGNAYGWFDRDPLGRIKWLRPINPGRVQVSRDTRTREKIFLVSSADNREQIEFIGTTKDILHIRGFGTDPLIGVSVIYHMREGIGRALAEDRHAATTMKNQGRPSGILSIEGKLDPDRATRLRERWEAAHGGANRAGRTAVLEDGAKWEAVTMTASDMELVQQRSISREDIAVSFQIPGDMLMVGTKANLHYSSDSTRDVRLVKFGIMPWAKRIEQGLEICDLFPWGYTGQTPGRLIPRFDPEGLLVADITTRFAAYTTGIEGGWLAPNEARAKENLQPVPGGDKLKPLLAKSPNEQRPAA